MRKQQLKVIANLVSIFLLCTTLLISISFGWYTNNKEVHANGLHASSATDSLTVSNSGTYSTQLGKDEPYPGDQKPDEDKTVTGVLAGDIVYFSISVISSDKTTPLKPSDLKFAVSSIFGDEYFTEPAIPITNDVYENHYKLQSRHSKYIKKERELHPLYQLPNGGEYYYLNIINNQHYINYVAIDNNGNMKLETYDSISKGDYNSYINSNNTKTDYLFPSDKEIIYDTFIEDIETNYVDANGNEYGPSGKEFYITTVDGVYYVNYIYETDTGIDDAEGKSIMRRYNMIDIYTYEVYKIFGKNDTNNDNEVDKDDSYVTIYDTSRDSYVYKGLPFYKAKATPLDKSITMFTLFDPNYKLDDSSWVKDTSGNSYTKDSEFIEITFTFKFVFNYKEYVDDINVSSVSYREIKFNNVIISEVTPANENENGGTE